jgi:purine-binding chemotaxis protein CheW
MSDTNEAYVLFELSGSLYGLPSRSVLHIEMVEEITRVPNANPAVEGVVFSRGQVIPALNLRVRFGFPPGERTLRSRIVFATIHNRTVGLIVDTAREFRRIPANGIRPIQESLTGINDKYIQATAHLDDRLVLILDLEAILKVEDVEMPESDAVNQISTAAT